MLICKQAASEESGCCRCRALMLVFAGVFLQQPGFLWVLLCYKPLSYSHLLSFTQEVVFVFEASLARSALIWPKGGSRKGCSPFINESHTSEWSWQGEAIYISLCPRASMRATQVLMRTVSGSWPWTALISIAPLGPTHLLQHLLIIIAPWSLHKCKRSRRHVLISLTSGTEPLFFHHHGDLTDVRIAETRALLCTTSINKVEIQPLTPLTVSPITTMPCLFRGKAILCSAEAWLA